MVIHVGRLVDHERSVDQRRVVDWGRSVDQDAVTGIRTGSLRKILHILGIITKLLRNISLFPNHNNGSTAAL
jgi:hypothetical protein